MKIKKEESIKKLDNIIHRMEMTIIDFKNCKFIDIDDSIIGSTEFFIGAIETNEERYELLFYKDFQTYTKVIYKK